MNCSEITDRLSAYRDGELNVADAGTLSAHLADCPTCRGRLERLGRVDAALTASAERSAGRLDLSRLSGRIASRIDARAGRPSRFAGWLRQHAGRIASGAVAAGLMIGVGLWLVQPQINPLGRFASNSGSPPVPVGDSIKPFSDLPQRDSANPPPHADLPPAAIESPPAELPLLPARGPAGSSLAEASPPPAARRPELPRPAAPAVRPPAVAQLPLAAPAGAVEQAAFADLLRQVEVVLTRAATLPADRAAGWSELANLVRRDDLVNRVRRARQTLPREAELAQVLASAETLLARVELVPAMPSDAAAAQDAIMQSGILDRCRHLRT